MKFKMLPRNLRKQTNNILNKNERLATNVVDTHPVSVFDKSHRHLTTFDSSKLIPIFVDECYPGDIFKVNTSTLIRLATPAAATMENPIYDIAFYFVPYRILWENFKALMGENKSAGYQKDIKRAPIINYDVDLIYNSDDLASYLGFPVNKNFKNSGLKINSLWFKAYGKVWNDYYRDENLQSEIDITNNNKNDSDVIVSDYKSSTDYNKLVQIGKSLAPVSRLADYFSTCLPFPQKGDAVTIDSLPLKNLQVNLNKIPVLPDLSNPNYQSPYFRQRNVQGNITGTNVQLRNLGINSSSKTTTSNLFIKNDNIMQNRQATPAIDGSTDSVDFDMGYVSGSNVGTISSTTGSTYSVNDLRLSLAIQHIRELDARGGTRYTEYLLNHFGIAASDARLDRAEYIGGFRDNINISNVVQSSNGPSSSPLGVLGGVSVSSAISPRPVNYAVQEHGIIMGFVTVRPQINYSQGLEKKFTRCEKLDYYDPLLANIGEQPVYKYELFLDDKVGSNTNNLVFGYNEAWADLRYANNKLSGYVSVNATNSIASLYTYTDNYANAPTLNPQWMESKSSTIGQTLLLNNQKVEYIHQFLADFYFNSQVSRKMPVFSIPGLRKV